MNNTGKCIICGKLFVKKSNSAKICDSDHIVRCSVCDREMILTKSMIYNKADTCSAECRIAKQRDLSVTKYGCSHPSRNKAVRQKYEETMMKNHGCRSPFELDVVKSRLCYVEWKDKDTTIQKLEDNRNEKLREISALLDARGVAYCRDFRLSSYVYSFCLTEYKTIIHVDDSVVEFIRSKDHSNTYLLSQYNVRRKNETNYSGLRYIHIYPWTNVSETVDRILPVNELLSKDCKLYKLNKKAAMSFISNNGIPTKSASPLLCLGNVYNNRIVQVMCFGASKKDNIHNCEILYVATEKGYHVDGGYSQLFNWAVDYFYLDNIVAKEECGEVYSGVFAEIGMKKISNVSPSEKWYFGDAVLSSSLVRQRKVDCLQGSSDKKVCNEQIMSDCGWLPCYTCGKDIYEYSNSTKNRA